MPRSRSDRRREQGRSFLGPALTVISANTEGFSTAKQQILAELCSNLHCDVLCLQETHRGSDNNRPSIPGMVLAIERPHRQYGSAIMEATSVSEDDNIEVLTIELSNVVIMSVYKPPTVDFKYPNSAPLAHNKPQIIIGDFNSHSTQWGYKETNKDGESVEEWMDSNQLSLIHDPKLPSSFHSARWRQGYNPDLAIVTSNITGMCQKMVLDPIPASQHRPIGILINAVVRPTCVPFKRRFNYKKADWKGFSEELDQQIKHIAPIPSNYGTFSELVMKVAYHEDAEWNTYPASPRKAQSYMKTVTMFEEDPFSERTTEIGEKVMQSIHQERRKTWQSLIESVDMTNNRHGQPFVNSVVIPKSNINRPK